MAVVVVDNKDSCNKGFQKDMHMVVVFQDNKDHMVPLRGDCHNIHRATFLAFRKAHNLFLEELQEVHGEVYMVHMDKVCMVHKELYKDQDQEVEPKAWVVYKVP